MFVSWSSTTYPKPNYLYILICFSQIISPIRKYLHSVIFISTERNSLSILIKAKIFFTSESHVISDIACDTIRIVTKMKPNRQDTPVA